MNKSIINASKARLKGLITLIKIKKSTYI
jgi:hypothetical protein